MGADGAGTDENKEECAQQLGDVQTDLGIHGAPPSGGDATPLAESLGALTQPRSPAYTTVNTSVATRSSSFQSRRTRSATTVVKIAPAWRHAWCQFSWWRDSASL